MERERDLHAPVCDVLGRRYPILQAGMSDFARSELVALRILRENATPNVKDRCVATGRGPIVGTRLSAKKVH
jgi:hypothetical protein